MTKKRIIIFSTFIIGLLVIFNIYIYNSNNNVNTHIQNSTSSSQALANISNFRIDINRMSQSQKLYLLTLKDEYKSEYEFYLNKISNQIDQLYTDGDIDSTQKTELLNALNEYKSLNDALVKNITSLISEETENILISANESQIKLLLTLDESIDTNKNSTQDLNDIVKNQTDSQVFCVQAISTVITSIISFFLYYFKKNFDSKDIGNIIKCIDDIDNEDDNKSDSNNKHSIELINKKVLKYEQMLEIINMIYKQNTKLECSLSKCEMILKDLRKKTNKLAQDSNTCNDYGKSIIYDIYDQLTELRILFESLPLYDNLLSDLHEIINENDN